MIDIDPNSGGLPGIEQLRIIVGAVMTVGLILSVLALIVSAIIWAYGSNSSNPHLAGRGKVGVLVSCGAAIICGAAVTLINFFWNVGSAEGLVDLRVYAASVAVGFMMSSNSTGVSFPSLR